ncbi:MAG: phosphoenolpyruvate synthase [Saliniramus fredricksonii]|uniref:Phosphoenolpyruvate synthase n=1 Tax=Saliniramus fredricksonii TaxID=1653334 RepID=A0A0P8A7L8_9HYPH|nr:phosphoenolpyruvate synthase [Saliniramus fredricksonii]KPQ11173.1 MAG: phosphoenolpyruvate synthase [Saliniramus fredricksonii]SCC81703.1 phosphoenolpyruvate synthase [Saliniramus fredricksonii]
MAASEEFVIWFEGLRRKDGEKVGGKNSSLGEMVQTLKGHGINVPDGFATTSGAYWRFVDANDLRDFIADQIGAWENGDASLAETGKAIRKAFVKATWPKDLAETILASYRELSGKYDMNEADVAVRSSATAEDLPDASFAGQQESFLNITGEKALLDACRRCYASLFTDRAISYRKAKGFDHFKVALSVGVQKMVRADIGASGVMFSIDTETGFDRAVLINAAWGLGENVVQGAVDPDEYTVFKPLLDNENLMPILEKKRGSKKIKMIYAKSGDNPVRNVNTSQKERDAQVLSDAEIIQLARWARDIEGHYECPMDIEWARDGQNGGLFIVQARPETVQSRLDAGELKHYTVTKKGKALVSGLAIGDSVVTGEVSVIKSVKDIDKFVDGSILVTDTTDPDWVPIMKRAAAIVTDHGGRTSHAAIVSRELGLPALVGTGDATQTLHDEQEVTVSCAEGDEGFVYEGIGEYDVETLSLDDIPETRTKIMLNVGNPSAAFRWWRLPAEGVGLARMEFVINNWIKVHPVALTRFDKLEDDGARKTIEELTRGYENKGDYFVDRLAQGLAKIAATYYPKPTIVRMSDFKTNEYAGLIGGAQFEPQEENPMLGFRGASRYYSDRYRDGFALECRAIRKLREEIGLDNVVVMIPFCRSLEEADKVLEVMAENGLLRGEKGLQVYVMCEIPSNVILAEEFAKRFDGFSIGSNDLTQLTLGVDRDAGSLSQLFDEQDTAVKWMIGHVIEAANKAGVKIGLCGQAPSDHPEFAAFLVEKGIDTISVTPDSFLEVKEVVKRCEDQR